MPHPSKDCLSQTLKNRTIVMLVAQAHVCATAGNRHTGWIAGCARLAVQGKRGDGIPVPSKGSRLDRLCMYTPRTRRAMRRSRFASLCLTGRPGCVLKDRGGQDRPGSTQSLHHRIRAAGRSRRCGASRARRGAHSAAPGGAGRPLGSNAPATVKGLLGGRLRWR